MFPANDALTVYVPAFVGAVAEPEPTIPALDPEKYSSVAAGDRFISLLTPSTSAKATLADPSYVELDHVIFTVAVACEIVIVFVAEAEP